MLGHLGDARQILEDGYRDYPSSVEIAQVYAKTLISLGDHESAVGPLKMVVDSNPDELEPYLDYAGALLTIQSQPDEAVRILRKAEQVSPKNPHTIALLAEALAESGDLEASQQTFYQALQSNLSKDEQWHSRLSFGLGKVSLKLSQPETAIASLQESIRTNPNNPQVYKALAEAFSSLDLRDEALEAAQNALMHTPDDVDMLTWYASLATKMESLNEAIAALAKYVDIKPNDTSMIVQLGMVQAKAGRESDARGTLKRVLSSNDAETNHLHEAALGLLKLNDPDSAATFLERAISQSTETDSHMLLDLANAYKLAGRSHQALETLNKAISIDTKNPETFLAKSDLLSDLGRIEDMRDCLENALNHHPENPNLRYRLIHLLRSEGDLSKALSHSVKLVEVSRRFPSSDEVYTARTLAADLARASLKPTYARSFFVSHTEQKPVENETPDFDGETKIPEENSKLSLSNHIEEHTISVEPSALFSYYSLSAELALEEGEEIAAAEALNQAIKYNSVHPWLLALQSRLANRRGDFETANETFHNACDTIRQDTLWSFFPDQLPDLSENKTEPIEEEHSHKGGLSNHKLQLKQDFVCTLLGLSAAAIELGEWETGLNMLKKVKTGTNTEPYTQLQLVRTIVLQAEYQSLCQALDVIAHAPGNTALDKETTTIFQNASQDLEQSISDQDPNDGEKSLQIITLWSKRGNSVFRTSQLPPFKIDLKPEKGTVILENPSSEVFGQNKSADTEY
ncbi:MAG: tetratricopeptide repeat protein, partial [Anaerolineales bacterium]